MRYLPATISGLVLLLGTGCSVQENVLLTWRGDTSTTMTINFQATTPAPGRVYFDTTSHDGNVEAYAKSVEVEPRQIPGIRERWFYTAELADLEPGGTYYFVAGTEGGGISREQKFQTLPESGPARFVEGGDQNVLFLSRRLMSNAALHEPQFCIIGGDIAYANGEEGNLWIWDLWHFNYRNSMVTPEGYLVPLMFAIGNHEVNDDTSSPQAQAPYFYGLLNQAPESNFVRTVGEDNLFVFLDSSHTQDHEDQVEWLEAVLQEHEDMPHKFAIYHVPLYPSHRSFLDGRSVAGRTHWGPLFDAHGVDIGFEHHDHTFKRSKRIRSGEEHPDGVLYLGDGSMGVPPRSAANKDAWYLEKASGQPHFWLIETNGDGIAATAFDSDNESIDQVTLPAEAAVAP